MPALKLQLLALERELITKALKITGGDVRAAARLLEVPERTLWSRLKDPLGLNPEQFRVDRANHAKIAE